MSASKTIRIAQFQCGQSYCQDTQGHSNMHYTLIFGPAKRQIGFKIGIASNNQKEVIENYIKKYGIKDYIDAFVSGEEITHLKPDPEMINVCLDKLGASAENSIYVGDTNFDIKAGKNAGTKTIAVTYGWHSREMLENEKPDELAMLVKGCSADRIQKWIDEAKELFK